LVWLAIAATALPVPYLSQQPGPVFNTLGSLGEQEFIEIANADTYLTSGQLDMTTVREVGGPQRTITLGEAVYGWLHPDISVIPRRASYPDDITAEQARTQSTRAFASSQEIALGAVLRELGIPFTENVFVVDVISDRPAALYLKSNDQIISVNGVAVDSIGGTIEEVRKTTPGNKATIVILRDGSELVFEIPTVAAPDSESAGSIGAFLTSEINSEIEANFADQRVGGPSAGLVFALAIYDQLTPGELVADAHIAVTGTITTTGEVGSIGGIRQKMIGAKNAGATVFLLPIENCAEAIQRIPDGLRAIPVKTLREAISVLEKLKSDASGDLPTCSAR
jgi:PDZ domain-containing protein